MIPRRTRAVIALGAAICSAAVVLIAPADASPASRPSRLEHLPDRLYVVDNHLRPDAPADTPALVDVIDPRMDKVTDTIPVGPQPHHIYVVPRSHYAYVTHFVGDTLDVIDLRTDKVTGHVTVGSGPRHLAFSPDGRFAFVVDYTGSALSVVNTRRNKTVATIPTGSTPNYPVISRNDSLVYIVAEGSGTVTVAQARAPFRVLRTIAVGSDPFDLAFADHGRLLVVANAGDDTLSLINTRSDAVVATVPIRRDAGPAPAGQKLNVRIDGDYAWVGDQRGADFAVIDLVTRSLLRTIPAASGADIFTPITIGPSKGLAITTARYGPYLDVVDPTHPHLIRTVVTAPSLPGRSPASYQGLTGPAGVGSHLLITNPTATRAYVSDRPGGTVSVLSLSKHGPRLLHNIRLSYGRYSFPDGMAYVHFEHGRAICPGG